MLSKMVSSFLLLWLSVHLSLGNVLQNEGAASLRASVQNQILLPLFARDPLPAAKVTLQVNHPGAFITPGEKGPGRGIRCHVQGSQAKEAEMYFTQSNNLHQWGSILRLSCGWNFNFPNADSGSCECTFSYDVTHYPLAGWRAGQVDLDCGRNACARVQGNHNRWIAENARTIVIEPIRPENRRLVYDGPVEVMWVPRASHSTLTLERSVTFTNSESRKQSEQNELSVNVKAALFEGFEISGGAKRTISSEFTSSRTHSLTTREECKTSPCGNDNDVLWQALFTLTGSTDDSISIASCIFQCSQTEPTCFLGYGNCG